MGDGGRATTVLYLGAELALFGILEDRVVAGACALHGSAAARLIKEGTIPTGPCCKTGASVNTPPVRMGLFSCLGLKNSSSGQKRGFFFFFCSLHRLLEWVEV